MFIMQKWFAIKTFWFFNWVISIISAAGIIFSIATYGAPHFALIGICAIFVPTLILHRFHIWQRGYLERLRKKKGSLWLRKSEKIKKINNLKAVICTDSKGYKYKISP